MTVGPRKPIEPEQLTLIVRDLARGRSEGAATLLPYLLGELKDIARGHLRLQRPGHTLQASALVNEAYLKLFDRGGLEIQDRMHFFALAAKVMRQVLVDHARRQKSAKRGGDRDSLSISVAATHDTDGTGGVDLDLLDLHLALDELSARDERQGRIVELRYFGGLQVAEVARVLSLSKTTVETDWRVARAWLGNRLKTVRER